MSTFEPEAFGKYYLVDKIATGGMAEIFKAKTYSHGGFENLLVIKRILSHLSDNDDFVEMFIDEAKVSVALQHPNIVRIYDFGKLFDNYFIAMECVEGKDLRGLLRKLSKRRQFLPLEFVAYIAHEACKGLDYAHSKRDLQGRPYGIVHRDISPSNILVSYEGGVKVADFGIARAESNTYNTADGVLKGKFEYMSPEQASGLEIDHRSDLFAIGIIMWEMLTGRRAFKTDSDTRTLERIKAVDIQPPSEVNGRVPENLEAIVMRALTSDREERYQSAKELQDDLHEFLFPNTPDACQRRLTEFMSEIFEEEISQEIARLEQGSAVARELRERAPHEEWDGTGTSTIARMPQEPQRSNTPLLVFAAILAAIGILAVLYVGVLRPAPEIPVEEAPTTGLIDIWVVPDAEVFLGGEKVGEGSKLELADLEPGDYQLTFRAEGYLEATQQVSVTVGQVERLRVELEKEAPPEPETPDSPPPQTDTQSTRTPPSNTSSSSAAGPPVVAFTSTPSGADVFIDGQLVGNTPFSWKSGSTSGSYRIEMRKGGYATASGSLSGLSADTTKPFALTLEEQAASPGKLTVALVGGMAWANVHIDGKKLDKTAPLSGYPIAPGSHTIRVENTFGLDYTETVQVGSGAVIKVTARPE